MDVEANRAMKIGVDETDRLYDRCVYGARRDSSPPSPTSVLHRNTYVPEVPIAAQRPTSSPCCHKSMIPGISILPGAFYQVHRAT